jgi:site-specific recombinase
MPEIALPPMQDVRDQVLAFFPPEKRAAPETRSLTRLFKNFLSAGDLATRLDAFIELKAWTSIGAPVLNNEPRLESLLRLLESQTDLRTLFQQSVREILTQIHSVELFAEAGLHPRERVWSEAARRILDRLLPSAREDTDLSKFLTRLYPTTKDIERVVKRPDEAFERMARTLSPVADPSAWAKQRNDLTQAFCLLGVHVAGIGLSPGLRARSHPGNIEDSPFYQLQQTSHELVRQEGELGVLECWRMHVRRCRDEMEYVHQRMEDTGVSTALVFDMGTIERALSRMENIANVLFVAEIHESVAAVKRLLDDVMNARREDMSVRALFRENSALMARKIVERTGKAGAHYIANSRSEYRSIWKASLGGGLLTVFTAAVKLRIVEWQFPPFVEGLAAGTNYALSFIVLQHLHLALATKQPSVTAATFAGIVRGADGDARLEKVTQFVSRISRSQLASVAGNLLAVCVGAVMFAWLWSLIFQEPYLAVPSAEYVYKTLDPLASGTMIFAALTGVILWVSALAGGWFENLATFHRVPEAIAQHPLSRKLGRERMKTLADTVDANLSGWATCIVLGYLLGFVPAIGRFLGIPLDVRHVTLNTGTVALAAASFGKHWLYRGWFLYTVLGIAVTFVLNLGVSFSIAAWVALEAYGVPRKDRLQLMRHTLVSFLRSPRSFLVPSAKDWGEEVNSEAHSADSRSKALSI